MRGLSHWRRIPADAADWFDPDEIARGRAYNRPLERLRTVRLALSSAVVVAFIAGDVGLDVMDKLDLSGWAINVVLVSAAVTVAESIVSPWFDAFRELVWDRRWGLSTQTVRGFLLDQVKNLAVGMVLNVVLLVPLWAVIRATDRWWLWGWLIFSGFTVIFGLLYPVLIAPIFNTFTPLEDGALRARVMAVAERTGLPINDVLVADASRRSRAGNAYVAGLGRTRRVVLFDTILGWDPAQVEQVVAHELGHWRYAHLRRKLPVLIATQLVMFLATWGVLRWDWLLRAGGVADVGHPGAVPIFLAVFPLGFVVAGLVTSWLSRADERQADLYALEVLDDPDAFRGLFRTLAATNKADVDPGFFKRLMASHPPIPERLAMASAWEAGAPG